MAPIPLARQQQVTAQIVQPTLVQPQRAGPDPVTGALVDGTNQMAAFTDKLAEAEKKQLDTLFRNSIAAELSQFETDSRARVIEFEAKGTGDAPFVKSVLDDFQERASKVGEKYSQEFRDEIKVKLLPIQETVAAAALAAQTRKTNEQVLANADLFQNNITNQVRFGAIGEQGALAKLDNEFAPTVPDNLRLGVVTKIREQIRMAGMDRLRESNPSAFMKQAKAGAFNDVSADFVSNSYERAARTILEQQERVARLEEKAREMVQSDPAGGAQWWFAQHGNPHPTEAQLRQKQIELGVHPTDIAVVNKDTAINIVKNFSGLSDRDQATGLIKNIQAEFVQKGGDWPTLQKNIVRFAREEGLVDLSEAFDVLSHPEFYPPQKQEAVFQKMKDPKAGEVSKKQFTSEEQKTIREKALSAAEPYLTAMRMSGADRALVERAQESAVDTAFIIKAGDKTISDEKAASLSVQNTKSELRLSNSSAYLIPATLSGAFPEERMNEFKHRLIQSGKLATAKTHRSKGIAETDLSMRAGWTMYDNEDTVALTVNHEQLYYPDGRPAIFTWNQLSTEVVTQADRERAAAEGTNYATDIRTNTATTRTTGGSTIVIGK